MFKFLNSQTEFHINFKHKNSITKPQTDHLPAGEDAGGGEEDDGYWVRGTQQPVAVKGRRDLLSQLLAQRHPGGRGQLPAIGKHCAAEDVAPRGIQGPKGASEIKVYQSLKNTDAGLSFTS